MSILHNMHKVIAAFLYHFYNPNQYSYFVLFSTFGGQELYVKGTKGLTHIDAHPIYRLGNFVAQAIKYWVVN